MYSVHHFTASNLTFRKQKRHMRLCMYYYISDYEAIFCQRIGQGDTIERFWFSKVFNKSSSSGTFCTMAKAETPLSAYKCIRGMSSVFRTTRANCNGG